MGYITKDSCRERYKLVLVSPGDSGSQTLDHTGYLSNFCPQDNFPHLHTSRPHPLSVLTFCQLCFLGPLRKCVRYLGKGHDKSMKLGFLSSVDDLIHADFPRVITILDVLCDAAVEQDGLLGHDANLGTQEGHVDTSRDVAINQLQRAIDFTISKEQ